jgi:formylmethanofuran dehydrogenase subunit C
MAGETIMAGTIVADDIQHSTAGSVGTEYVVQGSAKSWASFDMSGTAHIDASLNTSSLTDNTTGDSTIAFSSSMSATSYCVTIGGDYDSGSTMDNGMYQPSNIQRATSSLRTCCTNKDGARNDNAQAYWVVMGDLA